MEETELTVFITFANGAQRTYAINDKERLLAKKGVVRIYFADPATGNEIFLAKVLKRKPLLDRLHFLKVVYCRKIGIWFTLTLPYLIKKWWKYRSP